MAKALRLVCSNKPRPSVQRGAKGHAGWGRDVFHAAKSSMATLCGRDCSEWLHLDPRPVAEALTDPHFCLRCAGKAQAFLQTEQDVAA